MEFINGRRPEEVRDRIPFEHLTPLFPDEKFTLCDDPATTNSSTRIVDLFSPIGKGQRGMIVSPPKAGKTTLLKQVAKVLAYNTNYATMVTAPNYSKTVKFIQISKVEFEESMDSKKI